jgi:hypothetical protein
VKGRESEVEEDVGGGGRRGEWNEVGRARGREPRPRRGGKGGAGLLNGGTKTARHTHTPLPLSTYER